MYRIETFLLLAHGITKSRTRLNDQHFTFFTIRFNTHQLCQSAIRHPKCLCFVFILILMQTANSLDRQWSTAAQMTWVPWPHLNHPLLVFLSVPIRKLRFRLSHMLKITTLVLDRTGIQMPSVILFILLLLLLLSRFSRVRLCATPQMAAHQAPPFILVLLKAASWSRVGLGPKFLFGFVFKKCVNFLFWITSIFNLYPLFSFGSCILRPASINFRWLLPHLNCLVLNWVGNLTNIPFKCPGLLCLRCLIKFSSVYDEMWKYSIMSFFIKSNILNSKDYFILGFLSLLGVHGVFFFWCLNTENRMCSNCVSVFIIAVWRHNSHTIKFTLLKCTIHRDLQQLLLSKFRTFSSLKKEAMNMTPSNRPHSPLSPSPWQPLIYNTFYLYGFTYSEYFI